MDGIPAAAFWSDCREKSDKWGGKADGRKSPVSLGNPKNPLHIQYHDEERGVPVHDGHKLFEMLILESFQAELSWECIPNKREAFWNVCRPGCLEHYVVQELRQGPDFAPELDLVMERGRGSFPMFCSRNFSPVFWTASRASTTRRRAAM